MESYGRKNVRRKTKQGIKLIRRDIGGRRKHVDVPKSRNNIRGGGVEKAEVTCRMHMIVMRHTTTSPTKSSENVLKAPNGRVELDTEESMT